MLTASDFLTLPYTPDMTLAGIKYACQSLPYTYDRMGGDRFKRLRRIVAGKGVELAFKRHLNHNEIPHDMLGSTPFTDPDHYDIAIGGRCCDIKSFMLAQKERIQRVHQEPRQLLDAQALVPIDQLHNEHHTADDLYIFAFLTALLTPNQNTLKEALAAGQPAYLIYALPKTWAHPPHWESQGQPVVKSNASTTLKLEVGGQNQQHQFQSEQIILPPHKRVKLQSEFFTLSYLYTPVLADGTIGIHNPRANETILVHHQDWGNIWVYGMRIIFTGYLTRAEFRKKAERLPRGSRVFQYPSTRTENFSLPIRQLRPLEELFSQAKNWHEPPKSI